jgi:(R)-2-hydroxyacyl-CoA dehydratese activating ATPase
VRFLNKITAGIDAGSRAIKIVIFDKTKNKILAMGKKMQGIRQDCLAKELYLNLLEESKIQAEDVSAIVATGYGRDIISFADTTITEISCHARGVRHQVKDAATIIDIGGQDSKLIKLDHRGSVRDFAMNDRCAAGTGSFLEMVARKLEVELEELGNLACKSSNPAKISSMCVVFAETEIIGLMAVNTQPEDIVAGVQASIAGRIAVMAGRSVPPPVIFTGGVALVPGMDKALKEALGEEIIISPTPQMTGAIGAALLAGK